MIASPSGTGAVSEGSDQVKRSAPTESRTSCRSSVSRTVFWLRGSAPRKSACDAGNDAVFGTTSA